MKAKKGTKKPALVMYVVMEPIGKRGDVFSFESKENQKTCDAGVAWQREWRYALYLVSSADVPPMLAVRQ